MFATRFTCLSCCHHHILEGLRKLLITGGNLKNIYISYYKIFYFMKYCLRKQFVALIVTVYATKTTIPLTINIVKIVTRQEKVECVLWLHTSNSLITIVKKTFHQEAIQKTTSKHRLHQTMVYYKSADCRKCCGLSEFMQSQDNL